MEVKASFATNEIQSHHIDLKLETDDLQGLSKAVSQMKTEMNTFLTQQIEKHRDIQSTGKYTEDSEESSGELAINTI